MREGGVIIRRFSEVRADAFEVLGRGTRDEDNYDLLCVMQDRHERHVGIYCNALSHITALSDLLEHGAWCDDVTMRPEFVDDIGHDKLFRYYSTAFLLLGECLADLRYISRIVQSQGQLTHDAGQLMGFINRVWKHRETPQGTQPAFHRAHHHGPYLFADSPEYESGLPKDGRYMAIGHNHVDTREPLPLVVPSMVTAVRSVGAQVAAINQLLGNATARARVESAWAVDGTVDGEAASGS